MQKQNQNIDSLQKLITTLQKLFDHDRQNQKSIISSDKLTKIQNLIKICKKQLSQQSAQTSLTLLGIVQSMMIQNAQKNKKFLSDKITIRKTKLFNMIKLLKISRQQYNSINLNKLSKFIQNLIHGKITEFYNQSKCYDINYINQHSKILKRKLQFDILRTISQQFQNFYKLYQQILKQLNENGQKSIQQNTTLSTKCLQHFNKLIEIHYKTMIQLQKSSSQSIDVLTAVQHAILSGKWKQQSKYNPSQSKVERNQKYIQNLLAPIIEDSKIFNQMLNKLKSITNNQIATDSNSSLSKQCLVLVNSISDQLKQQTQQCQYYQKWINKIHNLINNNFDKQNINNMNKKIKNLDDIENKISILIKKSILLTQKQQKNRQIQQKNEQITKKIQNVQKNYQNKIIQYKLLKKQYQKIQQQDKLLKKQYQKLLITSNIFKGQIIQNDQDRSFIIDSVQKLYQNKKICKTKLLYSFLSMKIQNPHKHVDDVDNYIIIMTLENCDKTGKPYMLAMYSQRPLTQNQDSLNTGKGFIASITNKKVFGLVKNDKTVRLTQYNTYFIVFGKEQLKFMIGKDQLQLNIGHNFKSIDTGTIKNGEIFTGGIQETVKILNYQIYQIIFDLF